MMSKDMGVAAGAAPLKAGHTPTPWAAFNMVHADRGEAMTPEEIGEYVANSVRKSIEDGGSADRFLFITTAEDGGPDICHVGNGPRGPANAAYIVHACNSVERLEEVNAKLVEALNGLVGLVQLVRSRSDCPIEIKQALTANYRLDDALLAIEGSRT